MNKTEEFKSLQNVYYKRVLLKEEAENNTIDPKVIEKLNANKDELVKKIKEVASALEKESGDELGEMLSQVKENPEDFKDESKIEKILNTNPEEVKEESYVEEKLGARLASNLSGWKRFAMGERANKGESNVQSHRVDKRFEIFQRKIGSHLKELQRDLATTSDADDSVKKQVDAMVSKLESEFSVKPTESKLGDFRHAMGRGVEWAGKAAPLLALGAVAGSALASAAGVVGIPATMIKAATAGAIRKAATDVLNGKKPSAKEVATQAAILAVAAPILGVGIDYISDHIAQIQGELGLTANEPNADLIQSDISSGGLNPESYFERYHETPFNPESPLDVAKNKFDSALFERGLNGQGDWSNGPSPAFVNAAKSLNLSPEQYEQAAKVLSNATDEKLKPFMDYVNQYVRGAANMGEAQGEAKKLIEVMVGKK
jgi:hypothetical protein